MALLFCLMLELFGLSYASECASGYYSDEFGCRACHPSCQTCTSYNQCEECFKNYQKANGSNLCQFPECSQGQFYSISKEKCLECESSCAEQCSHQLSCYDCPAEQVFNLASFQCVASCASATEILVNNTEISDFPFCRSLIYYVNPSAEYSTELGTAEYPYKTLQSVFDEIYLVHSHHDRTITIKLMEDSTNFVHQNRFIIELNEVIIESYSEVSTVPRKAKLVATNTNEALPEEYTSPTLFKLIKSYNTTQEITNDSKISSADKSLMFTGDSILYIYKASLTLNNLYITTGFSSEEASKIYLNPIYLGSKTLKIHNSKVLHQGFFVKTNHQMNLEILDTEIDLYKSSGGFDLSLGCFNSDIQSTTRLDGLRLYYSQSKSFHNSSLHAIFKFQKKFKANSSIIYPRRRRHYHGKQLYIPNLWGARLVRIFLQPCRPSSMLRCSYSLNHHHKLSNGVSCIHSFIPSAII
ncbi:unnamed protein product [Moneuplotes crassus]|uniref:TNFR-Cys domain-containing protein n=1 Tax=Euplotes crassus TaxID=5936 RepID=A0AAD1UI10_EUPCR|nr:unnamed protein product [Moneuplotes crassus]